ncbi:MAG: hypothetical protein V4507_11110 [Verrucomicrobiota bacterium]
MLRNVILFLSLVLISLAPAQEMESSESSSTPFEPKKTNEIDPDVHMFGIPLGSSEDVALSVYGKPQVRIQFSDKLSGMMYQWNYVLFFTQDRLCGISVVNGALDYNLMKFVKNYKTLWGGNEVLWTLANGIHHKMSKKDVKKILKKYPDGKLESYRAFYSSKRCFVEIQFVGSGAEDKKDELGEAFTINVMEKGAYEEFNRYNP